MKNGLICKPWNNLRGLILRRGLGPRLDYGPAIHRAEASSQLRYQWQCHVREVYFFCMTSCSRQSRWWHYASWMLWEATASEHATLAGEIRLTYTTKQNHNTSASARLTPAISGCTPCTGRTVSWWMGAISYSIAIAKLLISCPYLHPMSPLRGPVEISP